MKNFMLSAKDIANPPRILFDQVGMRDIYLDLRCSQCGKIDEFAALSRGISEDIVFPKKVPDFLRSGEDFTIVSDTMRRVLDGLDNVAVRYFPFPSNARFFVAFPDEMVLSEENNKAFRVEGGCCSKCRRVSESVFGSELFPFRSDFVLGALLFERTTNVAPMWIGCEKVVESLKQAKLKGLEFHPYFKSI